MSLRVFVTGACGFVGKALCQQLIDHQCEVFAGMRAAPRLRDWPASFHPVATGDLSMQTLPREALQPMDIVVHLASRVHVMQENEADPLATFRRINVDATLNLARAAAAAGVRRFVFVSSVKVNGEATTDRPFDHIVAPAPIDPYGVSKMEAEIGLREIARTTGMDVVIVRPPLVYGPGVGANFLRLLKLVRAGLPLPLASVKNLRSMVYLGNLVDLIRVCVTHPNAAGKTFLASDGEDVSTPELLRRIATAMGRPARLLPFPTGLLGWIASIAGKGAEAERLLGSLQVDSSYARQQLDWQPPFTMNEGLAETVRWILSRPDA